MKEYLAVYGTLKRGHGNYRYYLEGNSRFLGEGITEEKYLMRAYGIPYVFKKAPKHLCKHIHVEVFEVDPTTLYDIDGLEGHPSWYKREKVKVRILSGPAAGKVIEAWLYFMTDRDYEDVPIAPTIHLGNVETYSF